MKVIRFIVFGQRCAWLSPGDWGKCECFGLSRHDNGNSIKPPLCIHRAPLGRHERFIGFLNEHHASKLPLWLARGQVRVITLNDAAALIKYAKPIVAELRANMVGGDSDFSATPMKAKSQDHQPS